MRNHAAKCVVIAGSVALVVSACAGALERVIQLDRARASAPTIIAAGVPKYRADANPPDYDAIFAELAGAGMTVFFPTFQYQELPTSLSLGHEVDFLPPCSFDDAAFVALRAHGVKLLVPGQFLYEPGNYPSIVDDPLAELIDCAGRELIHAVLSVDEPFGAITDPNDPYRDVRELYQRVKLIDPTMPVMMVHAPIPAYIEDSNGGVRPVTQAEIDYYLSEVVSFSQYADVVGFDVYPIPSDIATITSPYAGGAVVDYATALRDYLQWLSENMAGREYFLALQAFSYGDLWGEAGPPDPPPGLRPPSEQELREMACLTAQGGASRIVWWGQSFLTASDAALWDSVLMVSGDIAACGAPGDVDGDGDVDLSDLGALLAAYGRCEGEPDYNPAADFDDSGCVNLADLGVLLGNYGQGT